MLLFSKVTQSLETPSKNFKNFLSGSSFAVDSVDDRTPQHRFRLNPGLANGALSLLD